MNHIFNVHRIARGGARGFPAKLNRSMNSNDFCTAAHAWCLMYYVFRTFPIKLQPVVSFTKFVHFIEKSGWLCWCLGGV